MSQGARKWGWHGQRKGWKRYIERYFINYNKNKNCKLKQYSGRLPVRVREKKLKVVGGKKMKGEREGKARLRGNGENERKWKFWAKCAQI